MSDIPKFNGADWGQVEGKPVAYVKCDRERDRYHSGLEGSIVEIDGKRYEVLAVEKYPLVAPLREGEPIGLMVREAAE